MRPMFIVILLTASARGAGSASVGEKMEPPAMADVTVCRETLTLPHYVKTIVPGTEDRKRPELRTRQVADKKYRALLLENEYLKIQIVPELGGVIYRAVFKPTGDDLFYYEPAGKQWYVFWEGGVKASFPWAEHGLVGWGQPASCRVYRGDDGTTTVSLWMEFSRHIEHNRHGSLDCVGGYSVCLLSQSSCGVGPTACSRASRTGWDRESVIISPTRSRSPGTSVR